MTNTSGLWLASTPLVLASGSAARRQLLHSAGIPFEVQPAAIDERAIDKPLIDAHAPAEAVAKALALAKALAVSALRPKAFVLGGDQTLSLDGRMFHKPDTNDAAIEQLEVLAGRTHQLSSALALVCDGRVLFETVGLARLTMRPLSRDFLALYLDTVGDSVRSSVGGYQLEALGVHLFERIEGDQPAIMGLPLLPLLAALRDLGLLAG